MKNKKVCPLPALILLSVFSNLPLGLADNYAVYIQSYQVTKTTDNSVNPQIENNNKIYVTLVNVTEFPNSVAWPSYLMNGKTLTLEDNFPKDSTGTVINQGPLVKKILFSYNDDLHSAGGHHFSWSKGNLETLDLGKSLQVARWVKTSGVGVPRVSDNPTFFKEFRVVGWLHRDSTTSINTANPVDPEAAKKALEDYFKGKGYTVN